MMMMRLTALPILLLLFFCCDPTCAVDIPLTLTELTTKADHIVIGTVKEVRHYMGRWHGLGVMPFRDVTIEVQEEWKGKLAKKKLVLQVPGGNYPNGHRLVVEHQPSFHKGEKVLVFTRPFNGAQWVFGGDQGKYTLVVKRIAGKKGLPIAKDILTYPLHKRIAEIEAARPRKK